MRYQMGIYEFVSALRTSQLQFKKNFRGNALHFRDHLRLLRGGEWRPSVIEYRAAQ